MSGPLRICLFASLIAAGLATSAASANPFTALFNPAPDEAAAPAAANDAPAKDAPAQDECLPQPGKPTDGQHWVYRLDGHRRCWFLVAEGTARSSKRVRRHAARSRPASSEDSDAAPRKRKTVVDARAELLRAAPADTPESTPPAPPFKVVDAAPVAASGAATLVPPPPVLATPDQPTPDRPDQRQDNVDTLLAATPANSDAVDASAPATPLAADSDEGGPWWTTRWLGPLLMALGLVFLIGTGALRRAVRLWAAEREGRLDSLAPEYESQSHLHDPRDAQAAPRYRERTAEDARDVRPLRRRTPDTSFQDTIAALTDLEESSRKARSATLVQASGTRHRTRTNGVRAS